MFLAAVVWLAVSVLLLLAFYYVRPIFADFDVALPVLSQWLIQPWSWAIVMMVAIGVCVLSFSTPNPTKRRLAGVIALVVGLVALAAVLFGVLHPLISLIGALS